MITFLMVLMLLLCGLLIAAVLIQRGRGGGLAGAFGSGGGANSAFGTKSGGIVTVITVAIVVFCMLLSITLAYQYKAAEKREAPATSSQVLI